MEAVGGRLAIRLEPRARNARDLIVKEILVRPGDSVAAGQLLMVVEMLKIVVEVTAPRDGRVAVIHVRRDDELQPGDLLLDLE